MSTPSSARVSQSIKKEMSELLLRDIKDPRISGLVSITEVECSPDCRRAKIFFSVFGDEASQKGTLEALNELAGKIRGEICRRLSLRFAPEITFHLDDSLERGARVSAILSQISRGEI